MKNIKRTATRFGFIAAMLFALVATVMPVAADTITADGTLIGALVGTTTPGLAFTATLTGVSQTVTPTINTVALNATDSTNGTGFHITLAATSFKSTGTPTDVLGAFTFTGGTLTTISGGTVGTAGALNATPLSVFAITQAQEISNATLHGISPTFSLVIPATAIAHSDYHSTLTVAYATGP